MLAGSLGSNCTVPNSPPNSPSDSCACSSCRDNWSKPEILNTFISLAPFRQLLLLGHSNRYKLLDGLSPPAPVELPFNRQSKPDRRLAWRASAVMTTSALAAMRSAHRARVMPV